MNSKIFSEQMKKLEAAFRERPSENYKDIYWEHLKNLKDGQFTRTVSYWIAKKSKFPTISELLGAAQWK